MPLDSGSFRSVCEDKLGDIYDTKYMANSLHSLWADENPNTELEKAFKIQSHQQPKPAVTIGPEYTYSLQNTTDSLSHEAAYDAMMTGVLFAKAMAKIGLLEGFLEHQKMTKIQTTLLESIRGKLPLGGLKAPFCLKGQQTPYVDIDNLHFHCKLLKAGGVTFYNLEQALELALGKVRISLVYSDVPECYFTFKHEADGLAFAAKLNEFGGSMTGSLF